MQRRKLGQNGPEVSAMGIGAMSFAAFYGPTTEANSHAILDAGAELGIDHIDTSNVYGMGKSEDAIGSWLRARGGENPFVIATKAAICRDPETGVRGFNNSARHMQGELEKSLKRMGLERVDLFYVHRRDPGVPIEDVAGTMGRLVEAGKIGGVGFSEIAPTSLRRAHEAFPVTAVQSEYSLQTRQPELGLVQTCEALGVSLVAFSPVGRGLLTDTPPQPKALAEMPFMSDNPRFTGGNLQRNIAASQPLRDLAADMGVPTAALAIAWVLAKSPATLPIPGTRNVAHFRELVQGATLGLDAETMMEIETRLPVGWCHGARYSHAQAMGPEVYC